MEEIPDIYEVSEAVIDSLPLEIEAVSPALVSLAVTLPIVSELEHVIIV